PRSATASLESVATNSSAAEAARGRESMRADYVIIGAGSAGCVLANRLSVDPGTKVILIEAGGRDWSPYIHDPPGFMKVLDQPSLTLGYHAEPGPVTVGRGS